MELRNLLQISTRGFRVVHPDADWWEAICRPGHLPQCALLHSAAGHPLTALSMGKRPLCFTPGGDTLKARLVFPSFGLFQFCLRHVLSIVVVVSVTCGMCIYSQCCTILSCMFETRLFQGHNRLFNLIHVEATSRCSSPLSPIDFLSYNLYIYYKRFQKSRETKQTQ